MTTSPVIISGVEVGGIWYRQGPSFRDDQFLTISAKGPVTLLFNKPFDAGYPYRRGWLSLVIAVTEETEWVLARLEWCDSSVGSYGKQYILYLRGFGWFRFTDGDAKPIEPLPPDELAKVASTAKRVDELEDVWCYKVPVEPVELD